MVRLKLLLFRFYLLFLTQFQFLNGSIKALWSWTLSISWRRFQFLNGSIKAENWRSQAMKCHRCFNSSMVRLKLNWNRLVTSWNLRFNSSMVRLKHRRAKNTDGYIEFQFLNGSIKAQLHIRVVHLAICFNSSMVRLKLITVYYTWIS